MRKKADKFIYTSDIETYNKLLENLTLINTINKNNKTVYVFENNNKLDFSNDINIATISFGNVLYL